MLWALRNPKCPSKKKKRPALTGQQGLTEHMALCQIQDLSLQNGVNMYLSFFAENTCNLRSSFFSAESIIGDKYHSMLVLRSQIFEQLRAKFCRHALGYLEPARS